MSEMTAGELADAVIANGGEIDIFAMGKRWTVTHIPIPKAADDSSE